jgi:hypothetical protein
MQSANGSGGPHDRARRPKARLLGAWTCCAALLGIAGCGSGDGGDTPSDAERAIVESRLHVARRLYGSDEPPSWFEARMPRPTTGFIRTRHIQSTHLDSSASSRYEVCTDDVATAIDWSQTLVRRDGGPTAILLVETTDRYHEIQRHEPTTPEAWLHDRVFRCDYVVREGSDLDRATGPAGRLTMPVADAPALRALVQYLWLFTPYHNPQHVLLAEQSSETSRTLSYRLRVARLVRGGGAGGCDRIEEFEWVHDLDRGTRQLSRHESGAIDAFDVRIEGGSPYLCP